MSPENRLSALAQAQESVNASSKARERLALLFDKDTFVELDTFAKADGEETGVVTGYGCLLYTSPVWKQGKVPCFAGHRKCSQEYREKHPLE